MAQRKVAIAEAAQSLARPFTHKVLGQVDDYCLYLSRFNGSYRFHDHAQDELYVVVEGEIFIDYYDEYAYYYDDYGYEYYGDTYFYYDDYYSSVDISFGVSW